MPKKLSFSEIAEAYKLTGLEPKSGTVQVIYGGCCPIGALHMAAIKKGLADYRTSGAYSWCDKEYGKGFSVGFMRGFDGAFCEAKLRLRAQRVYDSTISKKAYEFGRRVGEVLFDKEPLKASQKRLNGLGTQSESISDSKIL